MFGLVQCNASIIARHNTDPDLFLVRTLMKNWLWPIITFFGVTGNILAIIVLTKRRMIMSSTNNYLVALAIVDIAYLLLTLIINTLQNPCFLNTSISEISLTICRPIADFSSNTSVWLTVTFTVERWVAITYPLRSRTWCTVYRARKIILSVLCASVMCTLPSAFEMKLVRVFKSENISNTTVHTSYIAAKPTVLGNSLLYHRIYFNFVTFAIIWIPLLFLIIFNSKLISYVRCSKKDQQKNGDGIKLRRHNRTSHNEQRKTTIMLIAVVLVFTVCQIPQAISLTVQSFFPVLSQTSKVLIYNNFANCLVAINASVNFLLYCCFSDRFRSIFRSNFTFLSKYFTHYIQPKSKRRRNSPPRVHSSSIDTISLTNHSSLSLHGNQLHPRISAISIEINPKYFHQFHSRPSQISQDNDQSWFTRWTTLSSRFQPTKRNNQLEEVRCSISTDSCASSPAMSLLKSPFMFVQQKRISNASHCGDRMIKSPLKETEPKTLFIAEKSPSKKCSPCLNESCRPTQRSMLRSKSSSFRTFTDKNQKPEHIWLKRRRSNSTNDQLLSQQKLSNLTEIIDVTV